MLNDGSGKNRFQSSREDRRNSGEDEFQIKRYYDPKYDRTAVKILPGEFYITNITDEMLVTVLGSCISACIRDPLIGYGGMNHFMLPEGDSSSWTALNANMRYGNYAMEVLINALLKKGAQRKRLEIKVFGGANVIATADQSTGVGFRNSAFIKQYLDVEGLKTLASDLGGLNARRIHYDPVTGKVNRLFLRRSDDKRIFDEEKRVSKKIKPPKDDDDGIELFE